MKVNERMLGQKETEMSQQECDLEMSNLICSLHESVDSALMPHLSSLAHSGQYFII